MTLHDAVIKALHLDDSDEVIFAKKPWNAAAEAILDFLVDDTVPASISDQGYEYFLESDIVNQLQEFKEEEKLSDTKFVDLIIYYAMNDAYPDWI